MQRLTGIINGIAGAVGQWQGGDKIGAGGTILDMLFPQMGGIFSAVGGLFGAFKKKKPEVIERIIEPVKIATESLSMFLGANPASMLYGGRGRVGGAAFQVNIGFTDGADEVLSAKVASRIYDWNTADGTVQ